MSDINAIGASMAAQTFSDGASGDGIMTCLVWGDAPPHSVSWQNPNEETISDVANEVSISIYLSRTRISPVVLFWRLFYRVLSLLAIFLRCCLKTCVTAELIKLVNNL